jgi:hypothetical protein
MHVNQVTPHIDIQIWNTFNDVFMDGHAPLQVQMQIQACNQA